MTNVSFAFLYPKEWDTLSQSNGLMQLTDRFKDGIKPSLMAVGDRMHLHLVDIHYMTAEKVKELVATLNLPKDVTLTIESLEKEKAVLKFSSETKERITGILSEALGRDENMAERYEGYSSSDPRYGVKPSKD